MFTITNAVSEIIMESNSCAHFYTIEVRESHSNYRTIYVLVIMYWPRAPCYHFINSDISRLGGVILLAE